MTTETFRSFSTKRDYYIKCNNLNCRSSNDVYLFLCKHAQNNTQVVLKILSRFNNFKSTHSILMKQNTVQ